MLQFATVCNINLSICSIGVLFKLKEWEFWNTNEMRGKMNSFLVILLIFSIFEQFSHSLDEEKNKGQTENDLNKLKTVLGTKKSFYSGLDSGSSEQDDSKHENMTSKMNKTVTAEEIDHYFEDTNSPEIHNSVLITFS